MPPYPGTSMAEFRENNGQNMNLAVVVGTGAVKPSTCSSSWFGAWWAMFGCCTFSFMFCSLVLMLAW